MLAPNMAIYTQQQYKTCWAVELISFFLAFTEGYARLLNNVYLLT